MWAIQYGMQNSSCPHQDGVRNPTFGEFAMDWIDERKMDWRWIDDGIGGIWVTHTSNNSSVPNIPINFDQSNGWQMVTDVWYYFPWMWIGCNLLVIEEVECDVYICRWVIYTEFDNLREWVENWWGTYIFSGDDVLSMGMGVHPQIK